MSKDIDYDEYTLGELREKVEKLGIGLPKTKDKQVLINILKKHQKRLQSRSFSG